MSEGKVRILFIDSAHPLLREMLEEAGFDCKYTSKRRGEDILEGIDEYDGVIIRSKIKLTSKELSRATRLKFIARVGSGLENIDVDYANGRGIFCFNSPEGNRDAVGEHAMGMLLSLFNNLCRANREVRIGEWRREENRGVEINNKTVGIVGYGNTGEAFARRLSGFNCKVIAYDKYRVRYSDRYVEEKGMEDLYEQCDILSLHVPLTDETNCMVNDEFVRRFKKNIYLINTSRGKVVSTKDLVRGLKEGKILGACLDVLEYEKTSFEELHSTQMPEEYDYLMKADNVLLSPHIAGWTHESNIRMAKILAQKIINKFNGNTK